MSINNVVDVEALGKRITLRERLIAGFVLVKAGGGSV